MLRCRVLAASWSHSSCVTIRTVPSARHVPPGGLPQPLPGTHPRPDEVVSSRGGVPLRSRRAANPHGNHPPGDTAPGAREGTGARGARPRPQCRPSPSATLRRAGRKSGCAMSTSRWARSRTVRPVSSAAPYSVTTTPVWWRGVETTEPSGSSPAIRETDLAAALGRRTQADQRVRVEVQLGTGHEVLVPADPRDLAARRCCRPPPGRRGRPTSAPLMETRLALREITVGSLTVSTGRNATSSLPSSHSVELADAQGEGGHRHAVEHALGVVGHLPGLMQPHQSGGEHLRVDAEAAERALGQLGGHDVGNGTDAGLQRRPRRRT